MRDQNHHRNDLRKNLKANAKSLIAFVGSELRFPDHMLSVFNVEFTEFHFARVSHLTDLHVLQSVHQELRLVVLEEDQISPLLSAPSFFFDAVGPTHIVVAVFDIALVAGILKNRPEMLQLDRIGFLPLHSQMQVWVSVMRLLLCGQNFVPPELIGALRGQPVTRRTKLSASKKLTPREKQVLTMVADGIPNKNIAIDLDLSVHTVKLHIHNVLRKIGATNRTQAANWFIQSQRAEPGSDTTSNA